MHTPTLTRWLSSLLLCLPAAVPSQPAAPDWASRLEAGSGPLLPVLVLDPSAGDPPSATVTGGTLDERFGPSRPPGRTF